MTYPHQKEEEEEEILGQRETYIFQSNIIHEDLIIQEKMNMNFLETKNMLEMKIIDICIYPNT